MLLCACLLPILCGILFKGGVPLLEEMLCGYFNKKVVLVPYYRLIDIGYSLLAPAMFCFVSAMVVLEERDEGLASYSAITPLGKKGICYPGWEFPPYALQCLPAFCSFRFL